MNFFRWPLRSIEKQQIVYRHKVRDNDQSHLRDTRFTNWHACFIVIMGFYVNVCQKSAVVQQEGEAVWNSAERHRGRLAGCQWGEGRTGVVCQCGQRLSHGVAVAKDAINTVGDSVVPGRRWSSLPPEGRRKLTLGKDAEVTHPWTVVVVSVGQVELIRRSSIWGGALEERAEITNSWREWWSRVSGGRWKRDGLHNDRATWTTRMRKWN